MPQTPTGPSVTSFDVGPFRTVGRHRPVDLLSATTRTVLPPGAQRHPFARPAPYAAVLATPSPDADGVRLALHSGGTELAVLWREGRVGLEVATGEEVTRHRSRRFGRVDAAPQRVALTLTGTHLTVFTAEHDTWVARGRVDLLGRLDTRDETWLAGLEIRTTGRLDALEAGGFGQLGLRDVRLVTEADGTPVRDGSSVWLSATSAGPGFFDTAHTSLWRYDTATDDLTHTGDLFFRRPDRPGVYGDHATHVLRDGDRWLVATSTWGDFAPPERRAERRRSSTLRITLAEPVGDPRSGEHVLDTSELPVPVEGFTSVATWDPHLVHRGDQWWVGYVSASRFFRFHPVLASGPRLDALTQRGVSADRTATEGTTVVPYGPGLVVVASDGRDGRSGQREAYPVFDTTMHQIGTLDAPYPSNIPWPCLVPPGDAGGPWLMLTFDGTPRDPGLLGYGTHGDLIVMRTR
ncbi:MAG: hypothetical protein ACI379_09655 [Nocardioides sp.]|uniref:hypothetical protein n=1 Tax=Nocardioides sp. TaxID=35761 RepID=UPI003F02CEF5